ncbi:hypothetical protein HPB50_002727 [Hyalomma asiaticum]|uniref:Uncharacterized protein n=1 Tax=Hyalomma asiaticum TaxID=266040 RepID=A0ACB7SBX1_HYAAI|nr:hypothetical protein HPB50_002727 [Hyalomma asiaticum]
MKAVTASLLAVFVASLAPHSVACWWPGQALRRYFGGGDATTAPPDTVEPYEANDVLYNATFAPTENSATTEVLVKTFSETSGGGNQSTTQAITVATAESSNDAAGTTAATTANMTVTSLLHAPVTQANLVATSVTSISNSSSNATTVSSSVTEPTTNSTEATTLSPTSYYSVETSTPSSAPTRITATVRANGVSESPVDSTTPSNYVSSIKIETDSEGSSTKDLATTGSSLILLSTVPGLQDDDVNDSTVTTTTSTTRRYKPVYVRRFTPWIITRSSSSLPATSTGPPTTSALTAARAQSEQDTLLKESSTVESVPRTNTAYQRRYQNYPSQQRTPTKSTASTKSWTWSSTPPEHASSSSDDYTDAEEPLAEGVTTQSPCTSVFSSEEPCYLPLRLPFDEEILSRKTPPMPPSSPALHENPVACDIPSGPRLSLDISPSSSLSDIVLQWYEIDGPVPATGQETGSVQEGVEAAAHSTTALDFEVSEGERPRYLRWTSMVQLYRGVFARFREAPNALCQSRIVFVIESNMD